MTETHRASRLSKASVYLGGLALLLAIVTVVQGMSNRSLQQEVATGQAQVAKAQTLANLDNSLVQLMAKSAVDNNDNALRDLLARNGVTFKANASAAAAAPSDTPADAEGSTDEQ